MFPPLFCFPVALCKHRPGTFKRRLPGLSRLGFRASGFSWFQRLLLFVERKPFAEYVMHIGHGDERMRINGYNDTF